MCVALYLSSSEELPTFPFAVGVPIYFEKNRGDSARVKDKFTYPHIRYVDAHEGCGCGYLFDGADEEALKYAQASRQALVDFMNAGAAKGARFEIFVTWEGSESKPISQREKIRPNEFLTANLERSWDSNLFSRLLPATDNKAIDAISDRVVACRCGD
jgi:hypothetical protein